MDVILHLDGDAFFASVEQALDPAIRGIPVMTGAERGIVAAFSYEAKARGISRGMQTWKAKEVCPELVVRSSDYRTYEIFSRRATAIMRRHAPVVEKYGIDECFARLPGATLEEGRAVAERIQREILRELGVGYSVGVAPTKVLAKVGSKWRKPLGITVVSEDVREGMLRELPVGKLWGVGRRMAPRLMAQGINTAHDLASRDAAWAAQHLAKPYLCMWAELNGRNALQTPGRERETRGSVQKTQTFWPATEDRAVAWRHLARNVERACEKLRREDLLAKGFVIFLKTQEFSYRKASGTLPRPTAFAEEVLAAVRGPFDGAWKQGLRYRATGITLWDTSANEGRQHRLFGNDSPADPELARLYDVVDRLNLRERKVWLGAGGSARGRRERVFRIPLLGGSAR